MNDCYKIKLTFLLKTGLSCLFSLFLQSKSHSAELKYEDYVYSGSIETVQFMRNGTSYSYPVLDLAKPGDQLILEWDDLDAGYKSLQYTFVHCESDWTKSNIFTTDYIDGPTFENVNDYQPSFNTIQKYTHYSLLLPSRYMRPKISGNYLLIVYNNGDENDVLISRRFYVVNNQVSITGSIHQPSYAKYRNTMQEVDFQVNYSQLNVTNPMNEMKAVIRQNGRWDNLITLLRPQYIRDNVLIYDYEEENLFNGYGEFRFVDLRSYKYPGYGVNRIKFDSVYRIILYPDQDRSTMAYGDWTDANGNMIISGPDNSIPVNELDYMYVYFILESPFPPDDGNVYLFGQLTDWRIQDRFKMTYDPENRCYILAALLKQGYYNFQYVLVDNKTGKIDPSRFEGSHYETENDYMICEYYKAPPLYTDLLVGVTYLNSVKNK